MNQVYGKTIVAFGKRIGFAILTADGGCADLYNRLGETAALRILRADFPGRIMAWEGYITLPGFIGDTFNPDVALDGRWRAAGDAEIRELSFGYQDASAAIVVRFEANPTPSTPIQPAKPIPKPPSKPCFLPAGRSK